MFVDDLFNKKTLTESSGGGSPWHAEPEQGMAEAGYKRDAYQRDYDNSVAGMGKRQSRAYQDDGGANDERHDLDPSDWYFVKDGKMFAISVYPNQEQQAISMGYSRTRAEAKDKADQQGVAESSQRVDSLVSDALKIMKGPEVSDAVAALKTVLGDREFNGRRGFYNFYIKQMLDMYGQQGVAEGMLDDPGQEDGAVASAIVRRILLQRTDLLSKHGPEKVGQAVDEVADFVGDVDEIGSSDVSGWIKHVEQMLGNMDQDIDEGWFTDLFKKKEPSAATPIDSKQKSINTNAGPFQPIVDVGTAFSYVTVKHDGKEMSLGLKTETVQESKIALEEVKLLRKTIQSVKKEVRSQMSELRQSYTDRVANRGAMIPGGGKVGTILRYAVRASRAAQRGGTSSALKAVQDTVIAPLDKMLLACDKFEIHLKKEIISGDKNTKEIKPVSSKRIPPQRIEPKLDSPPAPQNPAATSVQPTTKISGPADFSKRGFTSYKNTKESTMIDRQPVNELFGFGQDLEKQIAKKEDELKALKAKLASKTATNAGIQTGATALIDPDTERPYEKDKLAALYGYKEPEAPTAGADKTPAASTTAVDVNPVGFNAGNVMKLPGMEKYAKPAPAPKTANFGAGPTGYAKTTTSIKPPAAPSSPALAVPKAPAAPRVTSGGPTPAEKAALDKRIAAAAAAAPAVAETLAQVERMLESVNSKKSAEMVKAYVDQRFTELGLRNTTECRSIMARVVQESAIRRRQHAKSLAN